MEVGGLQVVIVEHLTEECLVVHVAEGIFHTCKVGHLQIVPAVTELIGASATTLTEARIAHLAVIGEHQTACLAHSITHGGVLNAADALIALAMVVGANVEERVLLPVIPAHQAGGCLLDGRCLGYSVGLAAAAHLCEKPTAAHYGRCLEVLQGACEFHFAADDTGEIVLHRHIVDGKQSILIHYQTQVAAESLCLAALPVEGLADGHICQTEGGLRTLGYKGKRSVERTMPTNASVHTLHSLLASYLQSLGHEGAIETEA